MAKRKDWKTRLAEIEEAVAMMAELDNMPSWEEITLEDAIDIVSCIAEMNDEENGDWTNIVEKTNYKKAVKFLKDFSK